MICKRCGLDVVPEKIEQGVLNNIYQCPECGRKFGGSTLFKKGVKVAGWLVSIGILSDASDGDIDGDIDWDA
jgi:uncharacterized Zn finger protein